MKISWETQEENGFSQKLAINLVRIWFNSERENAKLKIINRPGVMS